MVLTVLFVVLIQPPLQGQIDSSNKFVLIVQAAFTQHFPQKAALQQTL